MPPSYEVSVRIGEASDASGVPERMIRHYEKIGLLPPAARTAGGYRVYSDDDVTRLRFVARARNVAIPLETLRDLLTLDDAEGRTSRAHDLITALDGKSVDLDELRRELKRIAGR